MLVPTLKNAPVDAVLASHQLMLRAGLVRPLSSGHYAVLPTGVRVLRRIEAIIDDELARVGCQRVEMPSMLTAALWQRSGRWDALGDEMFRLTDRHGAAHCMGPTHEEAFSLLAAQEVRSYKQLPLRLYQIGRKYRDEGRPRYGLLRCREFTMKDLYTFDRDAAAAADTYWTIAAAYERIFERVGAPFVRVSADAGKIGGANSLSHEFHIPCAAGEDTLLVCNGGGGGGSGGGGGGGGVVGGGGGGGGSIDLDGGNRGGGGGCDYAANEEKAMGRINIINNNTTVSESATDEKEKKEKEIAHSLDTFDEVYCLITSPPLPFTDAEITTDDVAATMAPPRRILVRLPRGRELNEHLLRAHICVDDNAIVTQVNSEQFAEAAFDADAADGDKATNVAAIETLADANLAAAARVNCKVVSVMKARAGDACPECSSSNNSDDSEGGGSGGGSGGGGVLVERRGIEIGHIFSLGTKYTSNFDASFAAEDGSVQPLDMGCYGIGVTRLLAGVVEALHDERGIGGLCECFCDVQSCSLLCSSLGSPSALVTFICVLCTLRTQILRSIHICNRILVTVWPPSIAPYQVVVLAAPVSKAEKTLAAAAMNASGDGGGGGGGGSGGVVDRNAVVWDLGQQLQAANKALVNNVVVDDRSGVSFGFKQKDAHLIGYPRVVVVGKSFAKDGTVEVQCRRTGEQRMLTPAQLMLEAAEWST
jgi:prolyl-tRNA synthetase